MSARLIDGSCLPSRAIGLPARLTPTPRAEAHRRTFRPCVVRVGDPAAPGRGRDLASSRVAELISQAPPSCCRQRVMTVRGLLVGTGRRQRQSLWWEQVGPGQVRAPEAPLCARLDPSGGDRWRTEEGTCPCGRSDPDQTYGVPRPTDAARNTGRGRTHTSCVRCSDSRRRCGRAGPSPLQPCRRRAPSRRGPRGRVVGAAGGSRNFPAIRPADDVRADCGCGFRTLSRRRSGDGAAGFMRDSRRTPSRPLPHPPWGRSIMLRSVPRTSLSVRARRVRRISGTTHRVISVSRGS